MQKFNYFYKYWVELDEFCRNKILRDIFAIDPVSVSSIILHSDRISFRMYGGGVFYNYFISLNNEGAGYIISGCILKENGYIEKVELLDKNYLFIHQLFHCLDEFEVYRLMLKYL